MTAGKLAAAKPAATTDTRLYQCPIGRSASVVLNVCNQSGSSATYRVALKNYTQVLTLTGSTHTFNLGNPISSYIIDIQPGVPVSGFSPGDLIEDDLGTWSARILDVFRDTSTIVVPTKVTRVASIQYSNINPGTETFNVGDDITDATSGLVLKHLGNAQTPGTIFVEFPALSTSTTSVVAYNLPPLLTTTKYLAIPNNASTEIASVSAVNTNTNVLTLARAQQGTTAVEILPGTQATILDITATTFTINEGATFTATDTTLTLNNVTNIFTGDYLKVGSEFLLVQTVDPGTTSVNISRGALGSTATTHADGATVTRVANDGQVNINYFAQTPTPPADTLVYTVTNNLTSDYVFAGDATGNDPTLTVNVGDTLEFNLNAPGHPLRITNQDVGTVTWDTTGLASGTYYYVCENHSTMIGQIILTIPNTSPTIGNGVATARIQTLPTAVNTAFEFVHDLDGNGDYEWTSNGYSLDIGRVYRFSQSDASNTGHPFKFSDQVGLSPEYIAGVTYNGTPGSSGAYTQLDLTASSPTVLYSYSTTTGEGSYGSAFTISNDPVYGRIYLYDVEGDITATDTFTTGLTTPVTQTVDLVTSGPYGYVQSFSGTELKVTLGVGSPDFAANDEFLDTPKTPGGSRTTAEVSSVTEVLAEDYIAYGKTVSANSTDKLSGVVLGSGHSILVYSSSADLSFVVNGFEDVTNDWTTVQYDQGGTQGGVGNP
jgi:plastocyanin